MNNFRVLLSLIFITSGVNHILNWGATIAYMRGAGVVLPEILLPVAIVFLLAGGFSVLVGFHARLGALVLILFLVPTTLIFHDFWNLQSPAEIQRETISFIKNIGLLGGLLLIMGFGSGKFSLEWLRHRHDKES